MLPLDQREFRPSGIALRNGDETLSGAKFEHLPHLKELFSEFLGEAFERPAAGPPALEQAETAEPVEIVANSRGRDSELARQLQSVDLLSRLAIAIQQP